jgi:hypothetical protein
MEMARHGNPIHKVEARKGFGVIEIPSIFGIKAGFALALICLMSLQRAERVKHAATPSQE